MQSEIPPHIINQPNINQQVRQNLINQSNSPQLQMQNLQVMENLQQPRIRVNFVNNIQTVELLNYLQNRRVIIPNVPISKYKYFTQILMFFTCFIEMVFFECTFIHAIWFLWYPILGYHRHSIFSRKIRFFGELINFCLWLFVNCWVFSQHKVGLFPMIFLIGNMDYYFIGFNLLFTYFCFISYILWNCCADFRLKIIVRKLKNRKKQIVEHSLSKFAQNQIKAKQQEQNKIQQKQHIKDTQIQPIQQSIETMSKQKQLEKQKQQKNTCPICLVQLNSEININFNRKDSKVLRLNCSHRYHYTCLKSWIQTDQSKCPVCRTQMFQ